MRIKVVGRCSPECGVAVHGEVESSSREIVHRFEFPKGSEGLVSARATEVEGFHLATFGPDEREWKIECPLCRTQILMARFQR